LKIYVKEKKKNAQGFEARASKIRLVGVV